ncbi:hypothetical protein V1502_19575 [Bacillus sp. SCS-153A]|uniref:hypothetical protein n=1 Tax=Rossellomorea sedimentorum TaxID=3115294 RepID=UPI00390642A4
MIGKIAGKLIRRNKEAISCEVFFLLFAKIKQLLSNHIFLLKSTKELKGKEKVFWAEEYPFIFSLYIGMSASME